MWEENMTSLPATPYWSEAQGEPWVKDAWTLAGSGRLDVGMRRERERERQREGGREDRERP